MDHQQLARTVFSNELVSKLQKKRDLSLLNSGINER